MRKILIIIAIVATLLICIVVGSDFFFSDYFEERNLFSASDKVERIVIENSDSSIHEVFVLDSVKDVAVLKKCFSRVSIHMGEGSQESYTISFINDYVISNIPFPDLFSMKQINRVNMFIKDKNKKYQYTFQVKNTTDFQELKQNIGNSGSIAYIPYSSINDTKPSIKLSYVMAASDEKEYQEALYNSSVLGEFKHDNYFIPFIDDLEDKGLYFDNTRCHFDGGDGLNFSRKIEIYLTRSLTENEIIKIKNKSNNSCEIGNLQRFYPITSFIYSDVGEYAIKVLFDKEQNDEELKKFCQKYNIDSFDYEKKILDFDNITIYSFKNTKKPSNLNKPEYKKLSLSKDLNLVVKEYNPIDLVPSKIWDSGFILYHPINFIPFKDADPPFSIVEQKKISEKDYEEIRELISKYDILRIADNLGFAGYEFDRFCYIGIQIGDELYVCGGQNPFYHNVRFSNIRYQIAKILNTDFNF